MKRVYRQATQSPPTAKARQAGMGKRQQGSVEGGWAERRHAAQCFELAWKRVQVEGEERAGGVA